MRAVRNEKYRAEITDRTAVEKRVVMDMLHRRHVPETSATILEMLFDKTHVAHAKALTNITELLQAVDFLGDETTFHGAVENIADRYGPMRGFNAEPAVRIPEKKYPRRQIMPYQIDIADDLLKRGKISELTMHKLTMLFWKLEAQEDEIRKSHAEKLLVLGDVILDTSVLQQVLSNFLK